MLKTDSNAWPPRPMQRGRWRFWTGLMGLTRAKGQSRPGRHTGKRFMPGPLHFHWCLKVLIGFALIGHFVVLSFHPDWLPALFRVQYPLFLTLVLAGGGFAIWHHLIMKRARRLAAGQPVLVCAGGLFGRIRHPIYLGDAV
ncbi:hypothetical protein, partial [Wenzhouxiangella limi]